MAATVPLNLTCKIGGARAAFDGVERDEIAGLLDHAFGSEQEWEGSESVGYGSLSGSVWAELCALARVELGAEAIPNLLALDGPDGGVFVPAQVQALALPRPAGGRLPCASLPGLRDELARLAEHWDLPLDDAGLREVLRVACDPDDGFVADRPEVLAFARLALAANEAVRRDCPLWLVGA